MINNNFSEPSIRHLNTDSYGNVVSILMENEIKQVVDGKIVLSSLPDRQHRITISGYTEVGIKDKLDEANKFKCDYTNGILFLHPSKEGTEVNIDRYYSIGYFLIHASRVYLKDGGGNIITIEERLNQIEALLNP